MSKKLDEKSLKRFDEAVKSLVQLRNRIERTFDEDDIEWLETDIQSLKILAEKMETLYYA